METQNSDVIIVGGGIAGLVTAYECLNQGLSVRILERDIAANLGGLAKLSFGGMALVNTPIQRKMGIKDSPTIALKDWCSFANFNEHDYWPMKWAKYYVDHCLKDVYEWLVEHDLKFLPAVNWVERGQHGEGNSLPRYHILWGTGYRLVERFISLLKTHKNNRKLEILYEHKVSDFLKTNGCIAGCQVFDEHAAKQKTFHASHVVVATGGIAGDLKKVRDHWYKPWGKPPTEILNGSHKYADGLLHDVLSEQGVAVTHLDKMWNYAAGIPHPKPEFEGQGLSLIPCKNALWLDHSGKRIGPEPLVTGFDTNELCRRVSELDQPYTWQLLNWKIAIKEFAVSGSQHNINIRDRKLFSFLKEALLGNHRLIKQMQEESDHFIVADDLPSLVTKMNQLNGDDQIRLGTLRTQVEQYDEMISKRPALWNDDQLRRIQHARAWRSDKLRTCKPKAILNEDSGPLIAIKLRLISRKSLGGIQTDLQSRVLDLWGDPIDGLYAIGEAAGFGGGGASGFKSLEGTFLSACILTARAAAKSICKL